LHGLRRARVCHRLVEALTGPLRAAPAVLPGCFRAGGGLAGGGADAAGRGLHAVAAAAAAATARLLLGVALVLLLLRVALLRREGLLPSSLLPSLRLLHRGVALLLLGVGLLLRRGRAAALGAGRRVAARHLPPAALRPAVLDADREVLHARRLVR